MSKVCQVTGKRPVVGNNVSHANNKTKRRFEPNLHHHRFWLESEKRFVRLRLTTKGMRIIDKLGIERLLQTFVLKVKRSKESEQCVIRFVSFLQLVQVISIPRLKTNVLCRKNGNQKFDPKIRQHVIFKEAKIK